MFDRCMSVLSDFAGQAKRPGFFGERRTYLSFVSSGHADCMVSMLLPNPIYTSTSADGASPVGFDVQLTSHTIRQL